MRTFVMMWMTLGFLAGGGDEAENEKEARSAPRLVQEALREEIAGTSRRDELLQAALKQKPNSRLRHAEADNSSYRVTGRDRWWLWWRIQLW